MSESDVAKTYELLKKVRNILQYEIEDLNRQDRVTRYLLIKLDVISGNIDEMADEINTITNQPPMRRWIGGD